MPYHSIKFVFVLKIKRAKGKCNMGGVGITTRSQRLTNPCDGRLFLYVNMIYPQYIEQ